MLGGKCAALQLLCYAPACPATHHTLVLRCAVLCAGPRVAVWGPRSFPGGGRVCRTGPPIPHGHAPARGTQRRLRCAHLRVCCECSAAVLKRCGETKHIAKVMKGGSALRCAALHCRGSVQCAAVWGQQLQRGGLAAATHTMPPPHTYFLPSTPAPSHRLQWRFSPSSAASLAAPACSSTTAWTASASSRGPARRRCCRRPLKCWAGD